MLAALTKASIRRPLLVVLVWLGLAVGSFAVGTGVFHRLVSDVGMVAGSESDRAFTLLRQGEPKPVALTAVVQGRPAADPAVRGAVDAAVADLADIPGVLRVDGPLVSAATGHAL